MSNHRLTGWKAARKPVALGFCLLLFPLALFAQNGGTTAATTLKIDQFVGTYKGTAKRSTGDINFTLEIKLENGARRELCKRLVRAHQVQIGIRDDTKNLEYLIQHSSMLGGHTDIAGKERMLP